MLATYFIHDGGKTADWRLKKSGRSKFWEWMATWAVCFNNPNELGYEIDGYDLPELHIKTILTRSKVGDYELFAKVAETLQERREARKESMEDRTDKASNLANGSDETWLCWVDYNDESSMLSKKCRDSVEVKGSDEPEHKAKASIDFAEKNIHCLVSKPSIFGFGSNFQSCHNMIFCGLSDSYERFYQAVRRCWRFGQTQEVNVYIILSEKEVSILNNIERKQSQMDEMQKEMTALVKDQYITDRYAMYCGDTTEVIKNVANDSVGLIVYSPPFSSLYCYSNSDRDLGNSRNDEEFFMHFDFIVKELYRILMPGRIMAVHCMNIPAMKERDGYIGIKDFRGDLIRCFQKHGFIYHSEVTIWKNPVTEMQRTKALGLLHKQIKKDSSKSRMGMPDYIVFMRKQGDNPEPITHTNESYPVSLWQNVASPAWELTPPVWNDINQSNTLNRMFSDEESEKHIAPLQLDVIERIVNLYSNPNDVVFTPFMGIGSEVYQSVKMGRRAIGIELKDAYFEQAVKNMKSLEDEQAQTSIFDFLQTGE